MNLCVCSAAFRFCACLWFFFDWWVLVTPVGSVSVILGNEMAGEGFFPTPEVVEYPMILDQSFEMGFLAFSLFVLDLTRARAWKSFVTLSDT